MVLLKLIILGFLTTGCSNFSYLVEQGVGQLRLQNRARENSEVLKDKLLHPENKEKIKLIQTYKKYFYEYFSRPSTSIYSKTTILENPAVSYLVISSPHTEIKAQKTCFPIMGCFPYLGFFNPESAKDYAKDLQEEDLVTYIRPVYAYSTLGYFEDTILSSFFYYDQFALAELIFHELFHTLFFAKDEVKLNENLANFFGKKLAEIYFAGNSKLSERKERLTKNKELAREVVRLVADLQNSYNLNSVRTREVTEGILEDFLQDKFLPSIEKKCNQLGIPTKTCYPLHREWNNASFAAYLTYEKEGDKIQKLFEQEGSNLKQFLTRIEEWYQDFDSQSHDKKSFSAYLWGKLKP